MARLEYLSDAADAAVRMASEQGATWAKTKLCREIYRQTGRLNSVWQLQSQLRAGGYGSDRSMIKTVFETIISDAEVAEVAAREIRGDDEKVASSVAIITKLHNDSHEMLGGLEALGAISLERETKPQELSERGIDKAASVLADLEAPRQVILVMQVIHKNQIRRIRAELSLVQMKFVVFSAAVKQLAKQKKEADKAVNDLIANCKMKGSLHMELWDPALMIEEEHFCEVWATMDAGKIVWYRDEKKTEVDYTADLGDCKVVCAYDVTREGRGGGRLPPLGWQDPPEPEPEPEPDEGEEGEDKDEKEPEEVIPPLNLRFTFYVEIDNMRNPPVRRLLNSRQSVKGMMLEAAGARPSSVASSRSRPSSRQMTPSSRPNTTAEAENRPEAVKEGGNNDDEPEEETKQAEPVDVPFHDQIGEPPPNSRYSLAVILTPEVETEDISETFKQAEFDGAISTMDSWHSAFEYNGRYETDLGPLQEEVKKAQQRLFGPAKDFTAIERELDVQMVRFTPVSSLFFGSFGSALKLILDQHWVNVGSREDREGPH